MLLYLTQSYELYLHLDPPEYFPVTLSQAVQWQPENMPQLPPVRSTKSRCAFLAGGLVHHHIGFPTQTFVDKYLCSAALRLPEITTVFTMISRCKQNFQKCASADLSFNTISTRTSCVAITCCTCTQSYTIPNFQLINSTGIAFARQGAGR